LDPRKTEEAFNALVESESKGLFNFLFWSLGRREEAMDALQETLIRIHRGLAELRDEGSIRRWAYRIATNVAHTQRGKRRNDATTYGLDVSEHAPAIGHGGRVRTPDEELAEKDTNERLRRALAELPPELREPLLLHTVSGMKYREIADALDLPIGTVTSRIHAARQELQEALGDELDEV
jgi:RNA polymerase sigma-70 factor (ECF subfamily)